VSDAVALCFEVSALRQFVDEAVKPCARLVDTIPTADNHRMEPRLVQKQTDVAEQCRRFGVSRLEVFGSAAVGAFDLASSDYDFIARFAVLPGTSMARRFLGFSDALEALLGRPVDLMTDRPIENPFLRAAVEATRTTVYDESAAEALV